MRAPADGYTLLMVGTAQAINATLYDNLNFNFIRDMALAGVSPRPPCRGGAPIPSRQNHSGVH